MCGRYHFGEITEHYWEYLNDFVAGLSDGWTPRYNIGPQQLAPVVRLNEQGTRSTANLRWGLLPSWAKEASLGYKLFNARCDTVAEKPAFRSAFKRRRCLIPATGYYEWRKLTKSEKQAFSITMADQRPFAFYGLWESWLGPPEHPLAQPLETFAIITTDANDLTRDIHNRMPCLTDLESEHIDAWLDPEFKDVAFLQSLLIPFDSQELKTTPVSNFVNKVGNEGLQCVTPLPMSTP